MTSSAENQIRAHAEKMRGELEILRGEARKLQGEARLQADQHMNRLNDRIEELEAHPRAAIEDTQDKGDDVKTAAKRAWDDIAAGIERAGEDIRRQLGDRS